MSKKMFLMTFLLSFWMAKSLGMYNAGHKGVNGEPMDFTVELEKGNFEAKPNLVDYDYTMRIILKRSGIAGKLALCVWLTPVELTEEIVAEYLRAAKRARESALEIVNKMHEDDAAMAKPTVEAWLDDRSIEDEVANVEQMEVEDLIAATSVLVTKDIEAGRNMIKLEDSFALKPRGKENRYEKSCLYLERQLGVVANGNCKALMAKYVINNKLNNVGWLTQFSVNVKHSKTPAGGIPVYIAESPDIITYLEHEQPILVDMENTYRLCINTSHDRMLFCVQHNSLI